jgi:NAD(P)-dependent dehydrogenase (short-subunit alcohol dehydrogenase family)
MSRFQDRVVVITGGNGGIGMEISRAFSREGARVVLFAKDEQAAIDQAAAELGNGAWGLAGDITSSDSLDGFYAAVAERSGNIDVLVANAGICLPGMIADTDERTIDLSLEINVKGTFLSVQRALPHMNDGGAVVMTSSISNATGIPGLGMYGASKAAVRALARTMARELIGRNIRVNAVSPAPTDTETMAMPFPVPEEMKQEAIDAVPMKRLARPEEIAKAIVFLASDDASFITGSELAVDGGTTQL